MTATTSTSRLDQPTSTEVATGLEIRGLHKHYGAFRAVDDISLSVPEGRFYALLGPSGCGKTTTLRMVAGLEEPTAGQILIGGDDIAHKRPYQRPVNTVFQSYALFPHMSIFENVAFGLRRRKESDIDNRVNEMPDLVEMQHLAKRKPTQLSGGQQQRVAVVRALVNKPKVLLLDEPLGALDLKLRRQMQLELKRIQTEVGITFIHVTHDQEEAMTMADTIAVLNKGKVEQLGAPVDLYENPRTAFVAGFLGQTNLLSVNVISHGNDVVKVDFHGVTLALPAARMAASGTAVEAGVRPEKIQMADRGQAPEGMNAIDGTIIDTSFIGVSTQYLVRADADPEEELTVFSQNTSTELRRVGDQVSLYWHPEHTFGLPEGSWKEAESAEGSSLSTAVAQHVPGTGGAPPPEPGTSKKLTPYFLLLPLALVLIVFFVLPILTLLNNSLTTGGLEEGYSFSFSFGNYWEVWTTYWPQFLRSFIYAGLATVAAILISYPLAYTIAFKVSARVRPIMLVLVIAPFFTSFLIRTLAWTTVLADDGFVVSAFRSIKLLWVTDLVGLTSDGRVLATPLAVILGLTFNFLPFMTLPLYASLEKQDRALIEAAGDLYASSWDSFWKITWPLSLPGVVSGTLLTFIPAAGDYVNATFLGSMRESMAGNVIDALFLRVRDYNHAASLSISLMAAIVALVIFYVRRAGTEDLV